VYKSLVAGHFPWVIGGDLSCAIGTWSGLHRAIGHSPFGLIWIYHSSPVKDGLLGKEPLAGLKPLCQHPSLLGLELMEYNPHRDQNQVTANIALDLAVVLPGYP